MKTARLSGLLAAVLLIGCGGDELPRPEGFLLSVRFSAIDPSVVTNLNVNVVPQGMGEAFMDIPGPLTFNQDGQLQTDGPFTYDVAADGALEIDVTGTYVNDNALDNGDGTSTFTMQLWSAVLDCNTDGTECEALPDGRSRSPAPRLSIFVDRGAEVIGEGFLDLNQWPLPFDGSGIVTAECRSDAVMRCRP